MKQPVVKQAPGIDFVELDSVTTRRELGTFLEQIKHHNTRFTISKRGKVIALLVPITDQPVIEKRAREQELQQTYRVFDEMAGMATGVALTDVSQRINEYAYGANREGTGVDGVSSDSEACA